MFCDLSFTPGRQRCAPLQTASTQCAKFVVPCCLQEGSCPHPMQFGDRARLECIHQLRQCHMYLLGLDRRLPSPCSLGGRLCLISPERLLTGSLYDPAPPRTFPVLITRRSPKRCAVRYQTWWRELAPSTELLHATATEGSKREGFACAYCSELDAFPPSVWYCALLQLAEWLQDSPSVTLLSFERVSPQLERHTITQRSVLRTWLLTAPTPRRTTTNKEDVA